MKWMKERDLLIAQTMAFVQSVTGKMPDTGKTTESSVAFTVETPNPVFVDTSALVETSAPVERSEIARPAPAVSDVSPLRMVMEAPPVVRAPLASQPPAMEVSVETSRASPKPVPLSRPDLREDFQSEIRARVANFRAHQERFNREREAYCTATMAKVHAVLKESEVPPRLGE
jgi:hypothetical protein